MPGLGIDKWVVMWGSLSCPISFFLLTPKGDDKLSAIFGNGGWYPASLAKSKGIVQATRWVSLFRKSQTCS